MSGLFDFFISYRRKDTENFTLRLASALKKMGFETWLDHEEIHPGDSILASIENGMMSSIDAVIVLSRNYFDGWSEHERRAIFGLMTSKKIRIVPIWYQLDFDDVQQAAPMLADIKAINADGDSDSDISAVCSSLAKTYHPEQRRGRLFELFFRCVSKKYPDDWDLKMFLAVFDNDQQLLKQSCEAGANVNITDSALWNRYNKIALDCGCSNEWRKLLLYLHETGSLQNGN